MSPVNFLGKQNISELVSRSFKDLRTKGFFYWYLFSFWSHDHPGATDSAIIWAMLSIDEHDCNVSLSGSTQAGFRKRVWDSIFSKHLHYPPQTLVYEDLEFLAYFVEKNWLSTCVIDAKFETLRDFLSFTHLTVWEHLNPIQYPFPKFRQSNSTALHPQSKCSPPPIHSTFVLRMLIFNLTFRTITLSALWALIQCW